MGHRCFDVAEEFLVGATLAIALRLFIPPNDHTGRRKGDPYTLRVVVRGARDVRRAQ